MPQTIFQHACRTRPRCCDFISNDNTIVVLEENGRLQALSLDGQIRWCKDLPANPFMFRINIDGDLIAVLGKGLLTILDLSADRRIEVPIDSNSTLLELHKNSAVISGYRKSMDIISPAGKKLNSLSFEFYIHQFKTIPQDEHMLIYNESHQLVCADMEGEIQWMVPDLYIRGEINTGLGGRYCYAITPHGILQISMHNDDCYEIQTPNPIVKLSTSLNGLNLLTMDGFDYLRFYDHKGGLKWEEKKPHPLNQIKMAARGDHFLTVDDHGVVTCYAVETARQAGSDYLEIQTRSRVEEKETLWTVRPGVLDPIHANKLLTISTTGRQIGLVGGDGRAYFFDEAGTEQAVVSLTSPVESIGMETRLQLGWVSGGRQIKFIDFTKNKECKGQLEASFWGDPIINYESNRIFLLSKDDELLIFDLACQPLATVSLGRQYRWGIPCGAMGVVVYDQDFVSAYSDRGIKIFEHQLDEKVRHITYDGRRIVVISSQGNAIVFKPFDVKGTRFQLIGVVPPIQRMSSRPFHVVDAQGTAHLLNDQLTVTDSHALHSENDLVYVDNNRIFGIQHSPDSFSGYDSNGQLVWRFRHPHAVREAALTRNGLVFMTKENLGYLSLIKKNALRKHYSQYIEI